MRANGAINGGARGFEVGDAVIVQRSKEEDNRVCRVLGQVSGKRICKNDSGYYVFYMDKSVTPSVTKIALCRYADGVLTKLEEKISTQVGMTKTELPVTMHLKKFQHIVTTGEGENQTSVLRDLYFVASSFVINPSPVAGWTSFISSNPSWPLVTNNANSRIPMTEQLMADMTEINARINTVNYYGFKWYEWFGDYWYIFFGPGDYGDCEDFALTKADELLKLGYPASAIHIEIARISGLSVGHAWCVVQTTAGDYALDLNHRLPILNATFDGTHFATLSNPTAKFYCRQRQIGERWAFISPYGWMEYANNSLGFPWTAWYILDPLLNMFYMIPPLFGRLPPMVQVTKSRAEPGETFDPGVSTPSINFSEDNTKIHVADDGVIRSFRLGDPGIGLVQVGESTYSSRGFVSREGNIVEPVGLFGRQDPFAAGGEYYNIYLNEFQGVKYLASINADREGAFRSLKGAEVVSMDGYYDFRYYYLAGEFYDDD